MYANVFHSGETDTPSLQHTHSHADAMGRCTIQLVTGPPAPERAPTRTSCRSTASSWGRSTAAASTWRTSTRPRSTSATTWPSTCATSSPWTTSWTSCGWGRTGAWCTAWSTSWRTRTGFWSSWNRWGPLSFASERGVITCFFSVSRLPLP